MSITKFSCGLAAYFGKQLALNDERTDVLRYGFEIIIGEGLKIIVLLLTSYILGLFPFVLVSFLTVGSYRLFSGGYHARTYERCFVWSMVTFLGIGKAQLLLSNFRFSAPLLFALVSVTFISSYWIAYHWAPAETANKPLSRTEKKKQKKLSLVWVTLWFAVLSFIIFLPTDKTEFIILGSVMALMFQNFTVIPAGFNLLESLDTLADKLTRKI